MDYRTLGRTGVKVAPLALGTDNFLNPTDAQESSRLLLRALDAGINLIDTSNSYRAGEAERLIGQTLKETGRRDEALIATKVFYPTGPGVNDRGGSRLHLIRACEDSLKRLGTDHIDLYQLHRPDFSVPLEETLAALTDLVRRGLVRYVGSSTAPAWRVLEGVLTAELRGYARFASEQSPYNLLDRRIENELVPMALRYDVALLPWSPLAMGMLAGRYSQTVSSTASSDTRAALRGGIYAERVTPRAIEAGDAFVNLAREAGFDPAQLALLWVKDQPGVTAPIIGPRTLAQLEAALPVLEMTLPDDLRRACDEIVPPGGHVANFFNSSGWMRGT
jgi:aryl-alcohol dehydrogenase-like predicted oxidoreductase